MTDDDNAVPASPDAYKPTVTGFPNVSVNTADPRYQAGVAAAHKAGLTQAQWSQMLAFEAARVAAATKTPTASPQAPQQPAGPPSFKQQIAAHYAAKQQPATEQRRDLRISDKALASRSYTGRMLAANPKG